MSKDVSPDADEDRDENIVELVEPPPSSISEEQRRLEMLKLQFEWQKHLTTLTSGIIVLVTTVSYTVFREATVLPDPFSTTWLGMNVLLFLAFALFFMALGWAIHAMRRVIYLVATWDARSSRGYVRFRYLVPGYTLLGGVLMFVCFVVMTRS